MDRRNFITVSATSAVTFTAIPAAAMVGSGAPDDSEGFTPPSDMEEYVARVDAGLDRIASWSPPAAAASAGARQPERERLAQVSLQSLFLTGMLGDLPIPQQLDERMQARIDRSLPVFDEAVDGMTAFLGSRTEEDFQQAAARLREPGATRAIIDGLDREAKLTGVSGPRRKQMREMLEHVTWRMTHQPPSLVVHEYLDKVGRAADTDLESASRQRALAARIGEEVFWAQDEKPQRTRGQRGARVLGIGAIVFAVSGGLVAAGAFPAVFGMTVGAIMMLVGLVMMMTSPAPKPADSTQVRPDSTGRA